MNKILLACTIILVFLSSASLFGEETLTVPRTENPPVIDGKINESTWADALKFDNFKTIDPDYGKEPSQKTVAYMTYDSENIYFAIRSFDTDPDKIKSSVSSRDGMFQDDYVAIMLDTFDTMQEAFGFFLNPLGIQGDGMVNADGNAEATFDMVWFSNGQINEAFSLRFPISGASNFQKQALIISSRWIISCPVSPQMIPACRQQFEQV